MAEQSLQEKQFELLHQELVRIADQVEMVQRRLEALETLGPAVEEIGRLGHALESLAFAVLGREGPRLRRQA